MYIIMQSVAEMPERDRKDNPRVVSSATAQTHACTVSATHKAVQAFLRHSVESYRSFAAVDTAKLLHL